MSAYNPPTENLPVFDNSVFNTVNPTGNITRAQADLLYLHYPFGQGAEVIPSLTVTGTSLLSGAVTIGSGLNMNSKNITNTNTISSSTSLSLTASSINMSGLTLDSNSQYLFTYNPTTKLVGYEPSSNISDTILSSNNIFTGTNTFSNDLFATTLASTSDANAVSYNTTTKKLGYVALPTNILNSNNTFSGTNTFNDVFIQPTKRIDFNGEVSLRAQTNVALATTGSGTIVSIPQKLLLPAITSATTTKQLYYNVGNGGEISYGDLPSTILLNSNNVWLGTNSFSNNFSITDPTKDVVLTLPQYTITYNNYNISHLMQVDADNKCYSLPNTTMLIYSKIPVNVNNANYSFVSPSSNLKYINNCFIYSSNNLTVNRIIRLPTASELSSIYPAWFDFQFSIQGANTDVYFYTLDTNVDPNTKLYLNGVNIPSGITPLVTQKNYIVNATCAVVGITAVASYYVREL